MRTGPQLKGRQNQSPGGVRSKNQPQVLGVTMKGKAVSPTQGRTRNHPNVAPIPKAKIGGVTPNTYFANSRSPIHPKFDTKKKHD